METESSGNPPAPETGSKVKAYMQNVSEDAKDLLEEMLEENAFFRLSIDEVLQHPWLKDFSYEDIQMEVYEEMSSRLAFINQAKEPKSNN